ncbi:MAG: hypothetical protein FWE20_03290 [Defluviitaleaceae bacterium]|nr:hypothetical protein [Defluviitaleaceae bacterium]
MPRLSRLKRRALSSRQGAIAIIAVICFVTGIIVGAVAAVSREETERAALSAELSAHIAGLAGLGQAPGVQEALQSVVSNLMFVAIVWVLAFARIAGFLSFMVVMLQGVSYGFTTAALITALGVWDGLIAALVYLPQALIMTPALLFVCTSSVSYVCVKQQGRPNTYGEASLRKYAHVLAVAALLAVLAAALDLYLAPVMARLIYS